MVISAHDVISGQRSRFPRRDRKAPGLSARDAGITMIYRPKNPDESSVCINGTTITQEGVSHLGPHPEFHKWVPKVLRVEVRLPKKEESKAPATKSTPTQATKNLNVPTPRNQPTPNNVREPFPVKRGVPDAHEVIKSVRQEEMKALYPSQNDSEAVSAAQVIAQNSAPEESPVPHSDPVLPDLDFVPPTISETKESYPDMKSLREYASQWDLSARGYDSLLEKLVSDGKVRNDEKSE